MEVIWYGHSCFRLRSTEGFLVADPYGKAKGRGAPRLRADIVTTSHPHSGHNNVSAVKDSPFVIDGPGEYEVKGIFVVGVQTFHDGRGGSERGLNTAFCYTMEGMTVCHLGDLGHRPTQAQVEALGSVDVLLMPVGGQSTIGAALASEVVSLIGPSVVVPMHFRSAARPDLDPVDKFLKEMGARAIEPTESLRVLPGRLPDDPQVVLLEPRQ